MAKRAAGALWVLMGVVEVIEDLVGRIATGRHLWLQQLCISLSLVPKHLDDIVQPLPDELHELTAKRHGLGRPETLSARRHEYVGVVKVNEQLLDVLRPMRRHPPRDQLDVEALARLRWLLADERFDAAQNRVAQ